jgi:hypothetical protein
MALIVAVGQYPQPGKWKNLSSINDLHYIKSALLKQGFKESAIDTLKNESATKKNILLALDKLAAKAAAGDIVYFHFSGHGQQIEDDNADEADGYDEALIPYDAKGSYDPVSYKGENHLRDDELGKKLEDIRRKIGSQGALLVVLDACHSGTATRGNDFGICRGEPIPFKRPGYSVNTSLQLSRTRIENDGFADNASSALGNMITISASSPNQVNYEIKDQQQNGVGSLSYVFAQTLNNLSPQTDYETLFAMIRAGMQSQIPTQIPMIEGDVSQEVFANNYIKKQETISILQWINDSTFYIDAGLLNGINNGHTFKIISVKDKTESGEGRIINAGNFRSVGQTKNRPSTAEAYTLKVDGLHLASFEASVFIKTEKPTGRAKEMAKAFSEHFSSHKAISIQSNADLMLEIVSAKDETMEVNLVEKNDSIHYSRRFTAGQSLTDSDLAYFLEGIKRYTRIKFFRNIEDGGQLAEGMELRIIPSTPLVNGEAILQPLDVYSLEMINKSPFNLYYTIIDLMPDNEVTVLIPGDIDQPQDYLLRAGEKKTIKDIQVDEITPEGKEFFKVIFSKTPLDLRSVFKRSKTRGDGSLHSFENVLDDMLTDSQEGSHTRSSFSTVKAEEIGILTTGFTIQKR